MNSIVNKLNNGYTLYFSYDRDENARAGYLKKTDYGMIPSALTGEEDLFIEKFPYVLDLVKQGRTLQLCLSDVGFMFTAMLGNAILEGPYGEEECLDQTIVVSDSNIMLVLENREHVSYQKAYRLYGSDKYRVYTKKFLEGSKYEK